MPLTTTGRNNLLTNGVTSFTHVSVHMADPTAGNEMSGGSYARQAITWAAAGSGARANGTSALTVPMPTTGVTAVFFGIYDAASAGVLQAWGGIGSTVKGVFSSLDITTNNTIQSRAHGLTTDDRVFFYPAGDAALPTGLTTAIAYFVKSANLTTDAFSVASTSGGAAIDITADGEGGFAKTIPEVFSGAGGNIVFAIGALVVDLTFA